MPINAIANNQFRIYTAQKFLEGLLENQLSDNNLFVWIGKVTPWPNGDTVVSPDDTVNGRIACFSDMLAMKKVSPSGTSLVIPRFNWTAGTVYTQYTDQGALKNPTDGVRYDLYEPDTNVPPFYVLTDQFNVYKCLDNNGGVTSSVKPTGTSSVRFQTADGYIWKFMYQVPVADQQKFLTVSWIPIHQITANDGSLQWTVQQTAIPGTIEAIKLGSGGSGYTSAPTVTITGDGTGATATATVASGAVTKIVMVTTGSGYTKATVSITGNATATAIISPPSGHGSNAFLELGAMYAMVTLQLQYDESGKLTTSNDYRKFGLILNPLQFSTGQLFTSLFATLTTNITLSGVTGSFNADDLVSGVTSGASGVVVDYGTSTHILRLSQINGLFVSGETLNDSTSSASGVIASIANPDVKPNTGMILTTEHRSPLTRASDQLETFQIVLPL